MVYRVYEAVDLPLIGVGGIATAEDALDFLMAGACAVQVGSASYANPWAPVHVLRGLERRARRDGALAALVGAAHSKRRSAGAATGSPA